MNNLVSIITPSYNTEIYIEETINSILNQTYKNWEMIIVDDNSSDNSIEIISNFKDMRIKLFTNEANLGAAMCRNIGINKAKGKWIAFLDSDDLWDKEKLDRQVTFMENNKVDFSYTKYREINEQSISLNKLNSGPGIITPNKMRNYCYPGCLTVVYNQEIIGKVNIVNIAKNNDYALWLKIIKKSNCYLYPEVLSSYRVRKNSISDVNYLKLVKSHYILWRRSENKSKLIAILLTLNNIFFGIVKKIKYENKINRENI